MSNIGAEECSRCGWETYGNACRSCGLKEAQSRIQTLESEAVRLVAALKFSMTHSLPTSLDCDDEELLRRCAIVRNDIRKKSQETLAACKESVKLAEKQR